MMWFFRVVCSVCLPVHTTRSPSFTVHASRDSDVPDDVAELLVSCAELDKVRRLHFMPLYPLVPQDAGSCHRPHGFEPDVGTRCFLDPPQDTLSSAIESCHGDYVPGLVGVFSRAVGGHGPSS